MPDPLVSKVRDDDGTERYVAAGGPSDTGRDTAGVASVDQAPATPEPADPNDPDADQPAHLVTEEAPDADAPDAADGDGADPGRRKRRP